MKKKIEIEIYTPLTPNFIRTSEDTCLPISSFTEKELKQIGKKWIEELIIKARKNKTLLIKS